MSQMFLSRAHFPVTTLGPGRRIGVWVQGCSIQCPGCISPDTWQGGFGATNVADVAQTLCAWGDAPDGLTISGGEPFDQPEALAQLLKAWRAQSSKSVLVFTGYDYAEIAPWLDAHAGLIDALMAGPYLERAPQTKALRGSDNQSLHLLTPLGRVDFADYERQSEAGEKRLDLVCDDEGGVWFAGIPARGDMERLRQALRAAGHVVTANSKAAHP